MGKPSLNMKWYHVTRLLGVFLTIYGVLVDSSGDRGTIIIAGLGLLGYDKVARSENDKK
jgi:hypothetical protein